MSTQSEIIEAANWVIAQKEKRVADVREALSSEVEELKLYRDLAPYSLSGVRSRLDDLHRALFELEGLREMHALHLKAQHPAETKV